MLPFFIRASAVLDINIRTCEECRKPEAVKPRQAAWISDYYLSESIDN
jgi:hypothetical protein